MGAQQTISVSELRANLFDEIRNALGLPRGKFWRAVVAPFFWLPVERFSQFGAAFDAEVANFGFGVATKNALATLVHKVEVMGVEKIPQNGPLLIASNHPGTYDGLAIAAQLQREDVKIVVSRIPFIQNLKTAKRHFIFSGKEVHQRMLVIRDAIDYLKKGGAVLIFPSGHIDPEPAFMAGAIQELESWSRSLEIFVRKVPEAAVQVAIVSNVLLQRYTNNLLTKLRTQRIPRQRIAEFMQVISQMVFNKKFDNTPKVTFDNPFTLQDLGMHKDRLEEFLPHVVERAKKLMKEHIQTESAHG